MSDQRQRRVAIHEAAHATIALRLGLPLTVVSIRPTPIYGGVCVFTGIDRRPGIDPSRPIVLQHARPRRYTEASIRCSLAGPVANRLWWPSSGYVATPKLNVRPSLSPLADAELTRVEEFANAPGAAMDSDEDAAFADAYLLVGADLASAYYSWSVADTTAMVSDPLNVRIIERLADELLKKSALSPREVRTTIRRRPDLTWKPFLSDVNPADAWFDRATLERRRQAEQAERDFRRMVARRDRFDQSLSKVTDPTEAELRDLWDAADEEEDHANPED